jgi:hypothetical protein
VHVCVLDDTVASSNKAADSGNKLTAGEAVKLVQQQQQQQQQQHLPTDAEASHAQSPSHLASLPAEFAELEDVSLYYNVGFICVTNRPPPHFTMCVMTTQ